MNLYDRKPYNSLTSKNSVKKAVLLATDGTRFTDVFGKTFKKFNLDERFE